MGCLSLAVTTTSTTGKVFTSREGTQPPELVVETGQPDPMIAAAGDIACDPADAGYNLGLGTTSRCRQKHVSDLLVGRELAAVLPLGDLQYETGQIAAFQQAYDPSWGRVKAITHPAVGNHEYRTPGAVGYFDYFNGAGAGDGPAGPRERGFYSFDIQDWHLVALNSNCTMVGGCGPGSPQEQWLRADLAAHPSSCLLAYWHHPRFTSGARDGSAEVDPLWDALYEAGADVVLSGHEHGYERFARQDADGRPDPDQGIREFVVGTGGKDLVGFGEVAPNSGVRQANTFGVLELMLRSDRYEWRFLPEAGKTFTDSGIDLCEGSLPDTQPPSTPTAVSGNATDSSTIQLGWKASTDNDGVAEYRIVRDGQTIGSTSATMYKDTTVQPGTAYGYQVVAVDPSGNASPASTTATVATPGANELAFQPTDDAFVARDYPGTNYGTRTTLQADSSPLKDFLLRFSVAGVGGRSVRSAKLRLYVTDPSTVGGEFRGLGDTAWSEAAVNWNNAPAANVTPLASLGSVGIGKWYEVDVTPLVTGDGPISLRVSSLSSDGAAYSSEEGTPGFAPQLRVVVE